MGALHKRLLKSELCECTAACPACPPCTSTAAAEHPGHGWRQQAAALLASPARCTAHQASSRCSRVRMERMGAICWNRGTIV